MSVTLTVNQSAFDGIDLSVDDGIVEALNNIVNTAKSLAPGPDTGLDRNSFQWQYKNKSGGLNQDGGEKAEPATFPNDGAGYAGTNVEYDIYQEFGTKKMPAQPHWRPAAQIAAGKDSKKILEALNKRYETEVSKIKARKEVL